MQDVREHRRRAVARRTCGPQLVSKQGGKTLTALPKSPITPGNDRVPVSPDGVDAIDHEVGRAARSRESGRGHGRRWLGSGRSTPGAQQDPGERGGDEGEQDPVSVNDRPFLSSHEEPKATDSKPESERWERRH